MGPPSYMRFIVDRNVKQRMTVLQLRPPNYISMIYIMFKRKKK